MFEGVLIQENVLQIICFDHERLRTAISAVPVPDNVLFRQGVTQPTWLPVPRPVSVCRAGCGLRREKGTVTYSSCCSARDLEIPHVWLTGFLDNQLVVLIVSTTTPVTTVNTNEWLHMWTVIFINWFTIIGFILWWIKVCCLVILMKYYFIQGNHFKTSHIYWNNSIQFIKSL